MTSLAYEISRIATDMANRKHLGKIYAITGNKGLILR
jgi:hypothetical protein